MPALFGGQEFFHPRIIALRQIKLILLDKGVDERFINLAVVIADRPHVGYDFKNLAVLFCLL
jgi:hypothetical protein